MTFRLRPLTAAIAVAFLWLCPGAGAEDAKVTVDNVLPIPLDLSNPAQAVQTATIRFRVSAGDAPPVLAVVQVQLDKRATNFAPAFKFGAVQGTAPNFTVPLEINTTLLPFAGKYVAKVRATRTSGPALAEFEMSLERPAAQLAAFEELLFDRDPMTKNVDPDKLYITEQSGVAFVKLAFPLVSTQLRGPAGEALPTFLELRGSDVLRAGERMALKPVTVGPVPLGTSSGTVRIESAQLATAVELKFRLINRYWFGFLPITIVLFILIGLGYRKLLAERQELDQGLVEAEQAFGRLKVIADAQVEPGLQAGIGSVIAKLAAAIRASENAAALRTAANDAGTAVDKLLTEAATSRTESRTTIAALKNAFGARQGQPPATAALLEDADRRLDGILHELDRGLAQSLKPAIAKIDAELKDKLPALLEKQIDTISDDLDRAGSWPTTQIDAEAAKLRGVMNDAEKTAGDIAATVQASLKIAKEAYGFFVRTLRPATVKLAETVMKVLTPPPDDAAWRAVGDIVKRIRAEPTHDTDHPYQALSDAVHDLPDALTGLVRAQVPTQTQAVEDALAINDFVAAAKAAKAAANPQRTTLPLRDDAEWFTSLDDLLPPEELPPRRIVRILGLADAAVGHTAKVHCLIDPPLDSPKIVWSIVSGVVLQEKPEGKQFSFMPTASGSVIVSCEISHPDLVNPLSARLSIAVAPSASEQAVLAIRERMTCREWVMSAITGVFIAGAGTMIFSDTFVGNWRDFLFAALWGFTADVGTGRLRALAEPLIARQIPGLGK